MKASMKYLVLFSIVLFLESILFGSQLSKTQLINEAQVQAMIMQSTQAVQEFDKLLELKQQEKIMPLRILQLNQVVIDNNMHKYENARNQNIPVMSYDTIVSTWNHCYFNDLSDLEKLSCNNILSTQLAIATLKNMSDIDQWKYFHENVKKPYINNPSEFILYLECKLADHKQILQDSVHTTRSHQLANIWLNFCMDSQNNIKAQQKILEKISQEEDELRNYRNEYLQIARELKELWYGDEQAARTDRWAQLTKKLLQQDVIKSSREQRKFLQNCVNEKNLAIGRMKSAEFAQAKKECAQMAAEEIAMQNFLVAEKKEQELQAAQEQVEVQNVIEGIMLQIIERKNLFDREQQELLTIAHQEQVEVQRLFAIAEQEKQEIAKQAKKAKERVKLAHQKQLKKELKQQKADAQKNVTTIQEKLDEQQSQIQTTEISYKQCDDLAGLKIVPSLTYQEFLADMQGSKVHDVENYACSIQESLKNYAYAICDENMTDTNMCKFRTIIKQLFGFNQVVQGKNHRMAWYASLDPKIYKKMYTRFTFLNEHYGKYYDQEKNLEALKKSLQMKRYIGNKELQDLRASLTKAQAEKDKDSMRTIINTIKLRQSKLDEYALEYDKFDRIHKNIEVLHFMKIMHGSGGILNIERLSAGIDFSTWKEGVLSKDFITQRFQVLHNTINNEIVDVAEDNKLFIVQNIIKDWLKDYFSHIKLSLEDCQYLSDEISKKIGDLAQIYKMGHIDEENLEYSLHRFLEDNCAEHQNQYTQLQVNDIVQVQIDLMKYLASIISE